jgi:hypothetical protein
MFTPCSPRLLMAAGLFAAPVVRDAAATLDEFRSLHAEQSRTAALKDRADRIRVSCGALARGVADGRMTLNEGAYLLRKAVADHPGFAASLRANTPDARTEREVFARVLLGMVERALDGQPARGATLDRLEAEYRAIEERPAWPAV